MQLEYNWYATRENMLNINGFKQFDIQFDKCNVTALNTHQKCLNHFLNMALFFKDDRNF